MDLIMSFRIPRFNSIYLIQCVEKLLCLVCTLTKLNTKNSQTIFMNLEEPFLPSAAPNQEIP